MFRYAEREASCGREAHFVREVCHSTIGGTLFFTFRQRRNTSRRKPLHLPEGHTSLFSYGVSKMAESKLRELSTDFAVSIIELVKELKDSRESIISNQIGRSGTSIGANIHEAQYAHGAADFIAKLQIALKEASETGYWLELLLRTNNISREKFDKLSTDCTKIRVMLVSSINTVKENNHIK